MTVVKCSEAIHLGPFSTLDMSPSYIRCDNCGTAVTREDMHRAYHNAFGEALEILADAGVLETSDKEAR